MTTRITTATSTPSDSHSTNEGTSKMENPNRVFSCIVVVLRVYPPKKEIPKFIIVFYFPFLFSLILRHSSQSCREPSPPSFISTASSLGIPPSASQSKNDPFVSCSLVPHSSSLSSLSSPFPASERRLAPQLDTRRRLDTPTVQYMEREKRKEKDKCSFQ